MICWEKEWNILLDVLHYSVVTDFETVALIDCTTEASVEYICRNPVLCGIRGSDTPTLAMVKPVVGLIYSSTSDAKSTESRLLATYLGAHLLWGGYSSIRLIALGETSGSDGTSTTETRKSALVTPMSGKSPVLVEAGADFWFCAGMEVVKDCHVIIVCVCSPDTLRCAKALRSRLPKKGDVPMAIISFQHGTWNKNYKVIEAE